MDTATEIERFYHLYRVYMSAGKEEEAQALILKTFEGLSKEARSELLMGMMTIAMEDSARERDTITELQEIGIEALERLDKIEQESRHQQEGEKGLTK